MSFQWLATRSGCSSLSRCLAELINQYLVHEYPFNYLSSVVHLSAMATVPHESGSLCERTSLRNVVRTPSI
jgi:hypothetical protein